MKKRLFSFLLAFVLLFGAVAAATPAVSAANEMKASEKIIALIKEFEGFVSKPVADNGLYTIGYGTACDPKDYPSGITEAQADKLLRDAVKKYEDKLNSFVSKNKLNLSQQQFDALISFTYNLGTNWMNNESTFRSAVLKGAKGNDFIFAITMWCTAGAEGKKQVLPHLIQRRLIEANVYLNGVYTNKVPSNYKYVLFDNNIEDPANIVRVQGYDAKLTDSLRAKPTKSGYRFLGWYTAAEGGEWISILDAKTAGKTLYGHWQEGEGEAKGVAANYKRVTTEKVAVYHAETRKEVKQIDKGTTITVTGDFMDSKGVKWGLTKDGWVDLSKTVPEGYDANGNSNAVWVTVTGNGVNVRSGPGTNYKKVGTANKGQQLLITQTKKGGQYLWGEFTGGWICLDYTDYEVVIAESGDDAEKVTATGVVINTDKLNIRNRPGTSGTQVVGQYSRGDVITITLQQKVGGTTWGKTDKGWVSLYYVQVTPEAGSGSGQKPGTKVIATGVIIDCISLRIRSGPGTNYNTVGTIAAGTPVEIYEITSGGELWGLIDRGWISMAYVELDVEVSDSEDAVLGTVYNCGKLNVRSGPGTNNKLVGTLVAGTKVQIFEQTTVKDQKWGRVSLGWVCMDYIKLDPKDTKPEDTKPEDTKPEDTKPEDTKPEDTKPEDTKPEDTKPEPDTGKKYKTAVVTNTTEVRIRAGAGTNYEMVGVLKRGDRVVILATTKVGNATWARIDKGWVHMYYLQLDGGEVPENAVIRTVNTPSLKIRAGAGTEYDILGTYTAGTQVVIYEQVTVKGRPWGRTDKGWICLEYVR